MKNPKVFQIFLFLELMLFNHVLSEDNHIRPPKSVKILTFPVLVPYDCLRQVLHVPFVVWQERIVKEFVLSGYCSIVRSHT